MRHWIVMRLKGVPASAPLFIPFLGAVIGMKGLPRSVNDEAAIGIAGPIVVPVLRGELRTAFQEPPSHPSARSPVTTPADDP
jgi:Zn-dependent protease